MLEAPTFLAVVVAADVKHCPFVWPDAADLKEWKVVQFFVLSLKAHQQPGLLAYAAYCPAKVHCNIGPSLQWVASISKLLAQCAYDACLCLDWP